MSVFLLPSYCLSVACDFSVVNTHCSYDRKIQLKIADPVAVARSLGVKSPGHRAQVCGRWWPWAAWWRFLEDRPWKEEWGWGC